MKKLPESFDEILTFVKTFNKDDESIETTSDGAIVKNLVTSPEKFINILNGVYGDEFGFEILSDNSIKISFNPESMSNKGVQYSDEFKRESKEMKTDFYKLAERIDNDFVKIEVNEDSIKVMAEEKVLKAVANIVDKIDESLAIELHLNHILIKE